MESPSFDAIKTQNKINLSDGNNVSKRDNNTIDADSELTESSSTTPVKQSQQQLNETSTATTAAACS